MDAIADRLEELSNPHDNSVVISDAEWREAALRLGEANRRNAEISDRIAAESRRLVWDSFFD